MEIGISTEQILKVWMEIWEIKRINSNRDLDYILERYGWHNFDGGDGEDFIESMNMNTRLKFYKDLCQKNQKN